MAEWTFYPLHEKPAALDIVWCRFPLVEDPVNLGPKPRPGLIRSVFINQKTNHIFIEVAYGTSNPKKYSDHDLYIANFQDMRDAGLPQATIFHLDRTAKIPFAEEWCCKREDGSGPVIGHFNNRCKEYLKYLLSH